MAQWLILCTSAAGGAGSIIGWGIRIPHAVQCSQKKKKFRGPLASSHHVEFIPAGKKLERHITMDRSFFKWW